MIQFRCLILSFLFLEFCLNLACANKPTENVSSIIKSYAGVFTTLQPQETQSVTTRIDPKIEVQGRGFVYDFTKPKQSSKPSISNVSLVSLSSNLESTSADDYSGSSSVEESSESEEPKEPADHVIPFSEHENPKEPSTRPNYTEPGGWAKPPADKNIPLNFVPTKLYAQVRGSHTVQHLPREEAVKNAESSEEKDNAARLKEVVKETKANTVYTEEGYEDAAYDHAGHIRDADFHEDFDRKLEEELNAEKNYSGKKRPKTYKKHKPRKYRENNRDDFVENYESQSQIAEEARISKQQVDLEGLKMLKNALNQSVIDPKINVESGISELEKDLKAESDAVQLTSTEPHMYITSTISTVYQPPPTESTFQSKMDVETTTIRRNVFTVRPKKSFPTKKPKFHYNKSKKPLKAFAGSQSTGNYNAYPTTTVDYGNAVWGYLRENRNATQRITYPTPYFQLPTVKPVIANPLTVAPVNGRGPYLVVEEDSPDLHTENPSESQNFESTIDYGEVEEYNVTPPMISTSFGLRNTVKSVNNNPKDLNYSSDKRAINNNTEISDPVKYRERDTAYQERNKKLTEIKPQLLSESNSNFIDEAEDTDKKYHTTWKPPQNINVPVTYPHYEQKPHTNSFDHRPETDKSEKLVESDGSNRNKYPPVESEIQKSASPVTELLPPAPLSASEYATFQRQSNWIKPMPPTMMAMMPIIAAIHKYERQKTSFPFLFRRKRSTFGFFRAPNFKSRDKKHQVVDSNEISNETNSTKDFENLNSLLNEPPDVATKVVEGEIEKRFGNETKNRSDESSSKSLKENTKSDSVDNSKKTLVSKGSLKENLANVEIEVPKIDLSSIFEKDEVKSTTVTPVSVDTQKYPFYHDSNVLRDTALKYVINPKQVPKKTIGGMEFYDSRTRECEEVDPDLDKVVPEDEDIEIKRGPQKKKLRLRGLGDKIDCYKTKYFDENPLDNPLFSEKNVEMPSPPVELDPKKFASRILELPTEKDEYTLPKSSKNPEFVNTQRRIKLRRPLRQHVSEQSVRYHLHPTIRKPHLTSGNQQRYRNPTKYPTSIEDKIRPNEARAKVKTKASNSKVVPRYQRLVYEDIMGNIMNLEKFKKPHVPKQGPTSYSQHYKRDNNYGPGINRSKKLKVITIDGLVPPPKKNLRIFKRSIDINDNRSSTFDKTDSDVTGKSESTFRIIFTTPHSNQSPTENYLLKSENVNEFLVPNTFHTVKNSSRHSNRSEADPGHYGKFSTNENENLCSETRRKEPKYNVVKKSNFPDKVSKKTRDTTFASSTFVPVMINLYDNFTARIPRGSINNQAKQQVVGNSTHTKRRNKSKVPYIDNEESTEYIEEEPKEQFVTFKPIQTGNKDVDTENVYLSTPNVEQHKELLEFLEGNPPGYKETFTDETGPESLEDQSKELSKEESEHSHAKDKPDNREVQAESRELLKNDDTEDDASNSESEDREPDEEKEETYGGNSASDDSSEHAEENEPIDGNGGKRPKDDAQDDEPFVRFSSRPYSPPENYEDERYADLGPRVNKPYFYHPPFQVPAYEKYALDKSLDHSGDEYGHEESEDPEKYVFPWDNDEDDEDKEESEHHSVFNYHEYPWEKRERKIKERKKREKIDGNYYNENTGLHNYGKEATSAKLVYIPTKNGDFQGKNNFVAAQGNSDSYSTKFSSKYKSAKRESNETDSKGGEDTKKSLPEFIESAESIKLTDKDSYKTSQNNIKETLNKINNTVVINDGTGKLVTTLNSPKIERFNKYNSTTASTLTRSRGRLRKTNSNNDNSSETIPSVVINHRSEINRKRGRNRNISTISISTTTAKPNIRRRTRLVSSTTSTSRTTPRSAKEMRRGSRRPFRISNPVNSAVSATMSSTPSSTGRTVERQHRSRMSKETIITKTVEDDEDDDSEGISRKNISRQDSEKSPSKVAKIRRSKIKHRQQVSNISNDDNPSKKERVEKVTITMEETPDHVYKTKEIDKDGVKGKFVTITANNSSIDAVPSNHSRDRTDEVDDAEMEEIERRMEAFKSFDSVIKDTEDLVDEPSSFSAAEKYLVGSLLQKLPLPLPRKSKILEQESAENEDENRDEDDDDSDEDHGSDDSHEEDTSDEVSSDETYQNNNSKNSTDENLSFIKNPNNRKYYYVETR